MNLAALTYRSVVGEVLAKADVRLEGDRPWDITVNDERVFARWVEDSFLGFGESYMEGGWDCERIDVLCDRLLRARLWDASRERGQKLRSLATFVSGRLRNLQSPSRARQVCEAHYDLGNDLFTRMLDPRMVYTCAYWKNATTLEEAQEAKLEMVCRKLGLDRGMRVLDIGCGFGSFMRYAAERYGVECVGYTLSREQRKLGVELCAGLPVEFVEDDYRNIRGKFDRVVSIGMFEAVGHKNFRTFMDVVAGALKDDGHALLHTMGGHVSNTAPEPWFDKYIFPNGLIPSMPQLAEAMDGRLIVEDWHCIGRHYDPTLMAWNENFQRAWPELSASYSPVFKRMWEFYLLSLAGCFRARNAEVWQIVLRRS